MASYVVRRSSYTDRSLEIAFAGDGVQLAGQLDYPTQHSPDNGYPLLFVLHSAGWNTRADLAHFACTGLNCGYAVFRWDKRGNGRSGASGLGSTAVDAVLAYEAALSQPDIDLSRVVVLAQGEGTLLLAEIFAQFARIQRPRGVILAGNMLPPDAIGAIDTRVRVIMGEDDWHDWQHYAREACAVHNASYRHGASFYVAHNADRMLMIGQNGEKNFHFGVTHIIQDWLQTL